MAGERQDILARGSYFPGDWVRPRFNPGTWMAMVDVMEIFPGHRSITREGRYEVFDAPIGVNLRIEEAQRCEPILNPEKEWEAEGFEDPSAPPAERYKAMDARGFWLDRDTGEEVDPDEADKCWRAEQYEGRAYTGRKVVLKGQLLGRTSPDRINWTRIAEPLANYSVNGGISPGYDAHNKTYFAFMQPQGVAPAEPSLGTGVPETEVVRRAVGLARTKDFRHWPAAKLLLHPDAQDPLDISFYGTCYFAYPGRQDLHVLILPVFHQVTDHVDLQIAFSRDGVVWTRPERRAILSVGPRGSGEEGQLYPSAAPVELPDGYWAMRYMSRSSLHTVDKAYQPALFPELGPEQKKWARWRPHRLCGVEAENEGRFSISTVFRRENELHLNYRCAPGGWIRVELLQAIPTKNCPDVDPLEGFTFAACDSLVGDEVDRVVTWQGNGDISSVGEMVAIRVKMFQAKLFAYKV
jgi:hypothetical protein